MPADRRETNPNPLSKGYLALTWSDKSTLQSENPETEAVSLEVLGFLRLNKCKQLT